MTFGSPWINLELLPLQVEFHSKFLGVQVSKVMPQPLRRAIKEAALVRSPGEGG